MERNQSKPSDRELSKLKEENSALQSRLDHSKNMRTEYLAEVAKIREEKRAVEGDLDDSRTRNSELEQQVAALEQELGQRSGGNEDQSAGRPKRSRRKRQR